MGILIKVEWNFPYSKKSLNNKRVRNEINANLRCCVQGPTDCALAPLRLLAPPVRHCHPAPVTPGSDGGRLRDRRHDELPRRFRKEGQKKPTLPLLHRLDAYSHFIVRG